ncbi:MAG: CHAT domain-containing protein [Rubrivivax sp.]|nr:CHAT domain-containing protein [Rubrivivax sp.]
MATRTNGQPPVNINGGAGASDPRPIVFLVPGQAGSAPYDAGSASPAARGPGVAAASPPTPGMLRASVRLSAQRGGGELHRLEAVPGRDVVALHITGGPVLWLHPESARDLLLAQAAPGDPGSAAAAAAAGTRGAAPREVVVGTRLRWHGLERAAPTRGWMGDVVLAAIEVFTGRGAGSGEGGGVKGQAAGWVASQVQQKVDGQVEAGLYALDAAALGKLKGSGRRVAPLPAATAAGGPVLVLVHGTFVDTASTFNKLWTEHPARVRELFARYGGRVFALDHPTVGASPIANALTLVQALPKGQPVRLHLLTHSRGGLVAEVLARMAHQKGAGAADLAFFAGDALAGQRRELQELAREVAARDIRIERVVRVACPARGTLLASRRLDAYLSVLRWALQLAQVPVAPALVEFLAEVARCRADPTLIPGIAAMMPDAPVLRWLNEAPAPIAGDLLVVAGDLRGEGVGSWVKTLLADAFYWGDNDFVVHTRAMYAGSPRAGGAAFLLDQGGSVTHFNYFANERTAAAVVDALPGALAAAAAQPGAAAAGQGPIALPPGFAPIGPLSWRGEDASGRRGAAAAIARARTRGRGPGTAEPQRPAVFVLPGILGSNLRTPQHRIWLAFRIIAGLAKLAYQPGGTDGIADDGPIGRIYDDFIDVLAETHEVVPFGFDWRRPIEEEAQRLAVALEAALKARAQSGQPVRIVAHSMGGVLARTVQLVAPATWKALLAHEDARVLMLGTPNGGSWAPMQVLSGDDTFGNLLEFIGAPFTDGRKVMAAMPGFIQLQAALTDPRRGLDRSETWDKLAREDFARIQAANWWHRSAGESAVEAAYRWGVPDQAVLDQALALRRRLDAQVERDLPAFAGKMRLVIGHAGFTPDGFEVDASDGFTYLDAIDGGDGRVPHASAVLPGVRTWTVDIEHGSLASKERAFEAYLDLLRTGETARLKPLAAEELAAMQARPREGVREGVLEGVREGVRAGAAAAAPLLRHVRSRPSRQWLPALPPREENDVAAGAAAATGGAASAGAEAAAQALARAAAGAAPASGLVPRVTVQNGDLSFVREPLLIGHYRSLKLTGAEAVLDRFLGGAMSASLGAGLYAEAAGTVQVFGNAHRDRDNPWAEPHPRAAVVVGLGDEGTLTPARLCESVRQGVLAWAQRAAEAPGGSAATIELAATLMGSGGVGIQAGDAARAIVEGVHEANRRLAATGWPMVRELKLIELFLDRATEAWRALRLLQAARPGLCELAGAIATGPGARRRVPDSGYRGADFDLVRITGGGEGSADGHIEFSLDTRRARTEVRAEKTQGSLVRELVAGAAQHGRHDAAIGRTLFQLLVPHELEPFLAGNAQMVVDLDQRTAPIPWELLDTEQPGGGDPRPWALRCRLLRKLRTDNLPPMAPRDAMADDAVLVVGEPLAPEGYGELPGARAEAEAVLATLTGPGGIGSERISALVGRSADATAVIGALLARRWRIVHVAGHGEPPDAQHPAERPNGVVLATAAAQPGQPARGGVFLGPAEIRKMRAVPELVFVNCCHLAAHDARSTLADRPRFAAGVADALIALGVRCVVAAGWAVDDEPAKAFAEAFYASLLGGAPFIDAVGAARESAWRADPDGKTWAAYQCYGDPNWTYGRSTGDAQGARARAPALTGPAAEFDGIASPVALAQTLEDLAIVQRTQPGRDAGALRDRLRHLEARFGGSGGDRVAASDANARLPDVPDWGAIGAVAEAFAFAWEAAGERDRAIAWYERAIAAEDASASMKAAQSLNNLRARRAELRARAGAHDDERAAAEVAAARDELRRLVALHPSLEGHSLVGSANKRLALLQRRAGRESEARAALKATIAAYAEAERLARQRGDSGSFYPALNRIAAELVLRAGERQPAAAQATALKALRTEVAERHAEQPDFWSAVAFIELDLYEAVAERRLAAHQDALLAAFADVQQRCGDASRWESVATQAAFVLDRCIGDGAAGDAGAAKRLRQQLQAYAGARQANGENSGNGGNGGNGTKGAEGADGGQASGPDRAGETAAGPAGAARGKRRRGPPPAAQRPPVTSSTVPVE